MYAMLALLAVGGALIAFSDFGDDDDAAPDPTGNAGDDDEGWNGDQIRVTERDGDPDLIAPEAIDDSAFPGADLFGYAGSSADELIETNTTDETHQVIEGGGGDDVVEAGMGDMVDLRSADEQTGDDIEGEEGDQVRVSISDDDLEAAPELSVRAYDDGFKAVDLSDGEVPIFQVRLGSEDSLDMALPEGADGSVHVVEGVDTTQYGTASSGAELNEHYGMVLHVPEGQSLPDGLRTQEGEFFWTDAYDASLDPTALDGVRLLGRLDLGETLDEGYLDYTTEPPDPDEPLPPNYTLGYDHRVDQPILTVNGRPAETGATV